MTVIELCKSTPQSLETLLQTLFVIGTTAHTFMMFLTLICSSHGPPSNAHLTHTPQSGPFCGDLARLHHWRDAIFEEQVRHAAIQGHPCQITLEGQGAQHSFSGCGSTVGVAHVQATLSVRDVPNEGRGEGRDAERIFRTLFSEAFQKQAACSAFARTCQRCALVRAGAPTPTSCL